MKFVYVIVWVAGINCVTNAGKKLVIVQGAVDCFLPTL